MHILPHGVPNDIYHSPERYGCLDFKVKFLESYTHFPILIYIPQIQVEQAAIDHVRQEFAPSDNLVFQLVPPEFGEYAGILSESMGSPDINSENIWEIYRELVYCFEHLDDTVDFIEQLQVYLNLLDD